MKLKPLLILFVFISIANLSYGLNLRFPRVDFGFGKTELTQTMKDSVLNELVTLLNNNPQIVIQIDAHASPDEGTAEQKMKLSVARAKACKEYFVSQGIDSARIKPKGWGDTQTLMGCSKQDISKMKTKEEKIAACENDRRAEFRVLSFNYVPKGGFSQKDSLQIKKLDSLRAKALGK